MSLTLKIVSQHRQGLGEKAEKTFGQAGGTIGRSLETDWALPDGKRFLSSRHASIDSRSGSYYIVDMSKNGVFVNDAEDPVGRGKPQRLFSGDKLRIGEYEMVVSIENVDDTRETLLSTSHVDPVDARQKVEAPEPTGCDLVDEQVITGVGLEMFLEEDDVETLQPLYDKYRTGASSSGLELVPDLPAPPREPPAAAAQPPVAKAAAKPDAKSATPAAQSQPAPAGAQAKPPRAAVAAKRSPEPKPAPAIKATAVPTPIAVGRPATGSASNPLDAFFRGAGIKAPVLNPEQTEKLLLQLGQVTRELIVGVIDCLHLRALQKAQLKQSNTTIQARENNRLKFSANVEEGFQRLLLDDSEQYMAPVESVRTAFADLKDHQRALLAATRHALDEYLDRLEPEQIEQRATNGRTGALIHAANKLRYWDMYKDIYSILANRPIDEMPQPFLDALADAYEQRTAKAAAKTEAARKEAS